MKKQLLSCILVGALLGKATQIKAMEEDLTLALQTASASSSNTLPNPLPNNLSTKPSCASDNKFTHISEVNGKVRRYAYAKNLNIATDDTPKVLVLFGLHDNKLGFGVYKGTVGDHTMTFMKFIPFKTSISDYNDIKKEELLPQARELLEGALRELEVPATEKNTQDEPS